MATEGGRRLSIKYLISNALTGSLIGAGGKSIKELIEVSDARVYVSGPQELFPGTSDRVVLISGNLEAVSLAQTLVWEMIAQIAKEGENAKNVEWSPKSAVTSLGQSDEVHVQTKLSIPALASGLILGRGGATIRSIAEESGARITMTSKEDAFFTQERVLTISGGAGQCIKGTDLILSKLSEQDEIIQFANRGTTYSSPLEATFGNQTFSLKDGRPGRGGDRSDRRPGGSGKKNGSSEDESPIAETTITLHVSNDAIGNVFGKAGVTMREIISLSGAKVEVSAKGVYAEGTNNRIITITGSPACCQTAHLFITQKLQSSNSSQQNGKSKFVKSDPDGENVATVDGEIGLWIKTFMP
eukprot:gene6795-9308_t